LFFSFLFRVDLTSGIADPEEAKRPTGAKASAWFRSVYTSFAKKINTFSKQIAATSKKVGS